MRGRRLWWVLAGWLLFAFAAHGQSTPVSETLSVRLEPSKREFSARASVVVDSAAAFDLALAKRYTVSRITVDGTPLGAPAAMGRVKVWHIAPRAGPRRIELEWHGRLDALDTELTHRQTLDAVAPVAGERGSFLPSASVWHPQVFLDRAESLITYDVSLDLPAAQRGLVPGRLVDESVHNGRYRARFAFAQPAEGIDLMVAPYRIEERLLQTADGRPLRLRTYLHGEIADLAPGYLNAVKEYIDLYEAWIGDYPYTEFSVVSSPTPTGFGMPALTYLGIDVLRLPFIKATSLGHEILHNWWGNGVYPAAGGNWSEGLTTFMADYAYRERESDARAREMRLAWLRNLSAVPPGQDRPLVQFTSRTHGTSQIVGYDKAAMVFFMLRDLLGRDVFDAGIRRFWRDQRFRQASWSDLRRAFEAESGRDLEGFFRQWLTRAGVPALRLVEARRLPGNLVRVTLEQGEPAYALEAPLQVLTGEGEQDAVVAVTRERAAFGVKVAGDPSAVMLDPDFRIARRLAPGEAPPILRQVMVDARTRVLFLGDAAATSGRRVARQLVEHASGEQAQGHAPRDTPLLVMGMHAEVDRWLAANDLPPRPPSLADKGTAQVWTLRGPSGATILLVSARDAPSLAALARPIGHYGQQSWLVLEGGRVIARGVWEGAPQRVAVKP